MFARFCASPLDKFQEPLGSGQAGILVDAFEQSANVHPQGTGELHDIFNPEVSFAAFDPADVRPMQP